MSNIKNLTIDSMLMIDDSGMPVAPTIRQLLNSDIRKLYNRDKSKNKINYIKDCIVIYYLGDPKSPARQAGLSDGESLKMAIEQAGLEKNYIPDSLVLKLIKQYYDENITEAGRVVENIIKTIHNINLVVNNINLTLNDRLQTTVSLEEISPILTIVDKVNDIAGSIPSIIKKLNEAKQNLMYEKETETARGGGVVVSSMNAEDY